MATSKSWADRIKAAEKRGTFTTGDKDLSDRWRTCAVGEQRRKHGAKAIVFYKMSGYPFEDPIDSQLLRLGENFACQVDRDLPDKARKILIQIEKRAIVLANRNKSKKVG